MVVGGDNVLNGIGLFIWQAFEIQIGPQLWIGGFILWGYTGGQGTPAVELCELLCFVPDSDICAVRIGNRSFIECRSGSVICACVARVGFFIILLRNVCSRVVMGDLLQVRVEFR